MSTNQTTSVCPAAHKHREKSELRRKSSDYFNKLFQFTLF